MTLIRNRRRAAAAVIASLSLLLLQQSARAGEGPDLIVPQRAQHLRQEALDDVGDDGVTAYDATHVRLTRDIAYGADPAQRFDVYAPVNTDGKPGKGAPVIFMVHGGGWRIGDKSMRSVIENKVRRWAGRGFIVVSTNYRMLPKAAPIDQAQDVVRAIAAAQSMASGWGGDRGKFILMGHSAGAHLVALISTSRALSASAGLSPWLGTVALDSAALDVTQIMEEPHLRLYDNAFGRDPSYWRAASPYYALARGAAPILAVCSTRREMSCEQADRFAAKAKDVGNVVTVLRVPKSHREINERLGSDQAYTMEVEQFLRTLDPVVSAYLGG
jgi:acetyl esterase/lipase